VNGFRTEVDLRAPFEDGEHALGVKLLHIIKRPVKAYENSKWIFRAKTVSFTIRLLRYIFDFNFLTYNGVCLLIYIREVSIV
jgi:hypothetical protein